MKNMRNGYYKIGRSLDPLNREKTLQAEEPEIRLVASVEAPDSFEKELHDKYQEFRKRGEWFAFSFRELFCLKDDFQVGVDTLAAPSETHDIGHGCFVLEICRFGGGLISSRVRSKHLRTLRLEVPYYLTISDAEREREAENSFLEFGINDCWREYFWGRFRKNRKDLFRSGEHHLTELSAIYCPLDEKNIGFAIDDPTLGERLYLNESEADAMVFYERCKRSAEVYRPFRDNA